MQHQAGPALAALTALRELRQRIEGFVPFDQAEYIAELFDSAVTAVQVLANRDIHLRGAAGSESGS